MIQIYNFLWKRLADYGKKYQSGIDVVDDFNTKIKEIQLEVINDLSPYYQTNELVRGILEVWVREIVSISSGSGLVALPSVGTEVFMRALSLGVVNGSGDFLFEINPYTENEVAISQRFPQRKPDVSKRIVGYVNYNKRIQLYPKSAINYQMFYFIYPTEAKIAFTYTTVDGEDIMAYDDANSVNLAWNENAANIILYKLLEKYGISSRELLLNEYGKLGVATSLQGQQI